MEKIKEFFIIVRFVTFKTILAVMCERLIFGYFYFINF